MTLQYVTAPVTKDFNSFNVTQDPKNLQNSLSICCSISDTILLLVKYSTTVVELKTLKNSIEMNFRNYYSNQFKIIHLRHNSSFGKLSYNNGKSQLKDF